MEEYLVLVERIDPRMISKVDKDKVKALVGSKDFHILVLKKEQLNALWEYLLKIGIHPTSIEPKDFIRDFIK